jgi:hypothetical protein
MCPAPGQQAPRSSSSSAGRQQRQPRSGVAAVCRSLHRRLHHWRSAPDLHDGMLPMERPGRPLACRRVRAALRAGVTSTLAMFPLETVRTRLAVDHRRYMNVPHALRMIATEEGVLALYRVRAPARPPHAMAGAGARRPHRARCACRSARCAPRRGTSARLCLVQDMICERLRVSSTCSGTC